MTESPPPPASPASPGWPASPAELTLDPPEHIANWRPLVHWLLVIPHMIVAGVLSWVRAVLIIVCFFTVLFNKQVPRGIFDFMVMTIRYQWRTTSYAFFMREEYPPFDFTTTADADDPILPPDPARLGVAYPDELNRWLPLVKWFLAIPHYIVLFFLFIGGFFVMIFAFFAVLFTGRFPAGALAYLVAIERWAMRVDIYVSLLRDEYPPFTVMMD
jgi:hypothetical protein